MCISLLPHFERYMNSSVDLRTGEHNLFRGIYTWVWFEPRPGSLHNGTPKNSSLTVKFIITWCPQMIPTTLIDNS